MVIINHSDSIAIMCKKLYEDFTIHQSFTIKGLSLVDGEVEDKGEQLIRALKNRDRRDNWEQMKNGRERLRRRPLKNSIGGPQANKMFQYKIETRDGIKHTTIWRIQ